MKKDNHFLSKKEREGGGRERDIKIERERERDYLSQPMLFYKLHAAWKKEIEMEMGKT
jgi:hypothetical protein